MHKLHPSLFVGVEDEYGLGPPRRRCSGNCEDPLKYGIVPLRTITPALYLCAAPLHGFPTIFFSSFHLAENSKSHLYYIRLACEHSMSADMYLSQDTWTLPSQLIRAHIRFFSSRIRNHLHHV